MLVEPGRLQVRTRGGEVLFFKTGPSAGGGQHEIRLVKKSGTYMLVDAFSVAP